MSTEPVPMAPLQQMLHDAANKLADMIEAAREDLQSSAYYGHDTANFAVGINGATGGAAGELAALFNPCAAAAIQRILREAADQIGEQNYDCDDGCDHCGGHVWPVHGNGLTACDDFINTRGMPDEAGDWCGCVHITEAVTFARLLVDEKEPAGEAGAA